MYIQVGLGSKARVIHVTIGRGTLTLMSCEIPSTQRNCLLMMNFNKTEPVTSETFVRLKRPGGLRPPNRAYQSS